MSTEHDLEKILVDRRGWSLRQPRNENIVLMLTGGLDSSLLAEMSISELGARVFPFYIRRGAQAEKHEEAAARAVVHYLQEKYDDRIADLYSVDADIPPQRLKKSLDPAFVKRHGHPMRNAIAELYAVQYATMLSQNGEPSHTIAVGSIDGDVRPDSQPISFLTTSLTACLHMDDWQWQIMSPFMIDGLLPGKKKISKKDILDWGVEHQFPLHLTRSCTSGTAQPCDECTACVRRNELFQQQGITL